MEPKKQLGIMETPAQNQSLASLYDRLVESGQIKDDSAQRGVLVSLQELFDQLSAPPPPRKLIQLFRKKSAPGMRGIYIWGTVGRGKSMLMDLFFTHVPV